MDGEDGSSVFNIQRPRQRYACFAKQQPGRVRLKFLATTYKPFPGALYIDGGFTVSREARVCASSLMLKSLSPPALTGKVHAFAGGGRGWRERGRRFYTSTAEMQNITRRRRQWSERARSPLILICGSSLLMHFVKWLCIKFGTTATIQHPISNHPSARGR